MRNKCDFCGPVPEERKVEVCDYHQSQYYPSDKEKIPVKKAKVRK